MDPIQKQVIALSSKVDALYEVVAQLSGQMSDAFSECRLSPIQGMNGYDGVDGVRYPTQSYSSLRPTMEHKDVIADSACMENHRQSGERELTPEVQIQRLTAQLTAAYNRIAALEEQLIAQRIH